MDPQENNVPLIKCKWKDGTIYAVFMQSRAVHNISILVLIFSVIVPYQ